MPRIIDDIYRVIHNLKQEGMTILLVEQNTHRALEVADSVCVLESGRVAWQGSSGQARENPTLFESYLGVTG
jgi:branched-chain amino acid transport system ATP-binding protein